MIQDTLKKRYLVLRDAMPRLEEVGIEAFPFNAGCFALLRLPPSIDPHEHRKRLISDYSLGLVALPAERSLRLAYCSMSEDQIQEAVSRLVLSLSG